LARLLLFAHGRPSGQRERDPTLKLWRGLFLGIAGIVCGLAIGLGYHWMGGPRQAAPIPPPDFVSTPAEIPGRFQIVNGTPSLARNISCCWTPLLATPG